MHVPGDTAGDSGAACTRQMPEVHTSGRPRFYLPTDLLFELGRGVSISINISNVEVIPGNSSALQEQVAVCLFVYAQADVLVNQFELFFHPTSSVRSYCSGSTSKLGKQSFIDRFGIWPKLSQTLAYIRKRNGDGECTEAICDFFVMLQVRSGEHVLDPVSECSVGDIASCRDVICFSTEHD